MTGLEMLRKLANDLGYDAADVSLFDMLEQGNETFWGVSYKHDSTLRETLFAIAKQIEREHSQTCEDHEKQQQVIRDLQRKRDEALRDARHRERTRLSIMQALAVVTEMEHHVRGVEGAEDSPVARWAAMLREAVRCPAEAEEDARAAKWVREHGGLEEVARAARDADNRRVELCSWLGVDTTTGWSDAVAELDRRLMPPGMEWPRFEDGEPVKFGDMALIDGDADMVEAIQLWIHGRPVIFGDGGSQQLESGERAKRPAVLAADGEPLEVGQTVYVIANGKTHHVTEIDTVFKRFRSMEQTDGSHWLDPMCFTHKRPVLSADGVPIKAGDTVYLVDGDGTPLTVVETPIEGCYQSVVVRLPNGSKTAFDPSRFTHTKPEPPDSWEQLEKDSKENPFDYCKKVGHHLFTFDNAEEFKSSDLVRRAKALAERDAS